VLRFGCADDIARYVSLKGREVLFVFLLEIVGTGIIIIKILDIRRFRIDIVNDGLLAKFLGLVSASKMQEMVFSEGVSLLGLSDFRLKRIRMRHYKPFLNQVT
jgi:hypothetical protein